MSSTRTMSSSSLRNSLLEGQGILASRAGDERRLADEVAVRARAPARGSVDDEVAATPADEVDDGRAVPALPHLAHARDRQAGGGKGMRGSRCRAELEAEIDEPR